MHYSTALGEVKTYSRDQNHFNTKSFSYETHTSYYHGENESEAENFKKRLSLLITKWTLEESQKQDIKFRDLSKIESIIENIALKHECINVEAVNDSDGYFEKFFVIKIDEKTTPRERRILFNKIVDEIIPICEKKGLIELFMKTSIFLRR